MRTTIDLPDDLYRALKARAALSGTTLRELVRRLVEQGLRQPSAPPGPGASRRQPPPVIIQPTGRPIAALSRDRVRRLEEEEDEAKHARSARH
ncbi:MAG TPA: ribbon-helix-helix protein, CopG family [Candidatus Binatia bacterium]|nr:ribbon-helix-helix protein, CopG family [Candidatus Binatia bacterium]